MLTVDETYVSKMYLLNALIGCDFGESGLRVAVKNGSTLEDWSPGSSKNTKFNQALLETNIEVFSVVSMRFALFVRFINAYKGSNYKCVSY